MDEKKENDVLMMELPEYEEEFPPFAEAETQDISFVVNKEDIYRRNRLIAAEEQTRQLAEEEKAKEKRRAEFERIYTDAQIKTEQNQSQNSFIKLRKPDTDSPWWTIVKALKILMAMTAIAFIMADLTAPFTP